MRAVGAAFVFAASVALAFSPPLRRTTPPRGALIVRAGSAKAGEYPTIMSAVWAMPNDTSAQEIFIYPGTYHEQVYLNRSGPISLYGYTKYPGTQKLNEVTITNAVVASVAGSNDLSGTLRVHSNDTRVYNIDVRNDFGPGLVGGQNQAIAVSILGDKVGLYACGFYGFQDTVYTSKGRHAFLHGLIEGSVDFIFGMYSQAYFEANVIAISAAGYITASGRLTDDAGIYLLESNTITVAANANLTVHELNGNVWLGRPWRNYSRAIFKNTYVHKPMLNASLWSIWNPAPDERIEEVTYGDYNTWGPGVPWNVPYERASFSTHLTAKQAAKYDVAFALGNDYKTWVDRNYLL